MDESDIKIKSILDRINNESVPYGFEEKVMRKIALEVVRRRERRENAIQILIAIFLVLLFFAIMIYLNMNFFKLDLSDYRVDIPQFDFKMRGISLTSFLNNDSVKWILIGINIALLLIIERVVSWKLDKKN
jgi:membrane-associated PAP2 superfamily phosphatase